MKYLGIDYGTKRLGLAVVPKGGTMAFPLRIIPNTLTVVEDVAAICRAGKVDAVVIGESLDFQNRPNPLMKKITPFANALTIATGLPIYFMNEALSSREATHLQGDNAMNDASAAAIVLQSYLDKIHPRTNDELSLNE
jgi:putative holliday junction resolvase